MNRRQLVSCNFTDGEARALLEAIEARALLGLVADEPEDDDARQMLAKRLGGAKRKIEAARSRAGIR